MDSLNSAWRMVTLVLRLAVSLVSSSTLSSRVLLGLLASLLPAPDQLLQLLVPADAEQVAPQEAEATLHVGCVLQFLGLEHPRHPATEVGQAKGDDRTDHRILAFVPLRAALGSQITEHFLELRRSLLRQLAHRLVFLNRVAVLDFVHGSLSREPAEPSTRHAPHQSASY